MNMSSECLAGISQPTELPSQYHSKTPNPYPQILICPDEKREQHNNDVIRNYLDNEQIGPCGQVFNVRNLNDSGLLQAGYARNIDLDSELKRINHYDDKCYYDNYKKHPDDAEECNGLYENKHVLVNDYSIIGKFPADAEAAASKVPLNAAGDCQNGNPNDRNRFDWKKQKLNGPNCFKPGDMETFKKCATPAPMPCNIRDQLLNKTDNMPVYYNFNDTKYCADYPCQRAFYNFTRRSTIPNFHNLTDVNPKYLSQRSILDNKNYSSVQ